MRRLLCELKALPHSVQMNPAGLWACSERWCCSSWDGLENEAEQCMQGCSDDSKVVEVLTLSSCCCACLCWRWHTWLQAWKEWGQDKHGNAPESRAECEWASWGQGKQDVKGQWWWWKWWWAWVWENGESVPSWRPSVWVQVCRPGWQHKWGNIERWDKDALEGGTSEFWFWLWVPLSTSSFCDRLGRPVSSSDVVVVLLGKVDSGKHMLRLTGPAILRSFGWDMVSECGGKDRGCLDVRVSNEGGRLEKGQPGQVQAWCRSKAEGQTKPHQ